MRVPHRLREAILNVLLAEALAGFEVGPRSQVPRSRHPGTPDVVFAFRGLRCAIGGQHTGGAQARTGVAAHAVERVETGLAQLAIAVLYPQEFQVTALRDLAGRMRAAEYEFTIATETGLTPWHTGTVASILDELRHAQAVLARDDAVQQLAAGLADRLDGIADLFLMQPAVCDRLTGILDMGWPPNEAQHDTGRRRQTAAKVAALMIANALIFQEQLAAADERVKPLCRIATEADLVGATREHWKWICREIDCVPIFGVAEELLARLPTSSPAAHAVSNLAGYASSICARKAALRHDLMGRIYHWLLHQAKFLGTYYTSVPAATLLLNLTLDPGNWPQTRFGDCASFGDLRIADPSCGTGTLLMAARQAMTDNFVRARAAAAEALDDEAMRNLQRTLLENVLHGYDVLTSAIHLTASTLALLAPQIAFRKMRLYAMPLGRANGGQIQLGSLDFLCVAGSAAEVLTPQSKALAHTPFPKLHVCVMNPPFTRSVNGNLLFGSVPDTRGEMQHELKRRVADGGLAASITAGLGSIFVALGDRYLEPGGRLALVLPAALTTGDAWLKTRKLIAARYHLETVVTSHDAGRWAFSENTGLSEILVVARKREPAESLEGLATLFINLWRNPRSSGEALSVAHEVGQLGGLTHAAIGPPVEHGAAPLRIGGRTFGEVVSVPTSQTTTAWIGGAFAQTETLRAALWLTRGRLYLPGARQTWAVPVARLGNLAQFGPDGRDIHDGFEWGDSSTSYPALWGTDAGRVRTIQQQPNKWLTPRAVAAPGRPLRDVNVLWPRAARLMLSTRLWLTTQRLFAVMLPERALSNIWAPTAIAVKPAVLEPALSAWLNSSLALLHVLLIRVPTRGSWIQLKKPNLRELLVLDVSKLAPRSLDGLLNAHERVKSADFLPYSKMADDPLRAELDDAVSKALGLPDLSPIRMLLGREPIVSGESLSPHAR